MDDYTWEKVEIMTASEIRKAKLRPIVCYNLLIFDNFGLSRRCDYLLYRLFAITHIGGI